MSEIRDGIIKAQLKRLEEDGLENLKEAYAKNWLILFEIADLGKDLDTPLTTNILSDPNHPVVKCIMYLYSMQSFIYPALNKACRNKDIK